MSDNFIVRSHLRDYPVHFVTDFLITISNHYVNETSFYLIDKKLIDLYSDSLQATFYQDSLIPVEAREINKNLEYCQVLIKQLIEKGIRKDYTIVAIGGGITEDIASLIASLLYRGIDWIFFPTTLLAQADSCIGSKSSINIGEYKNLLGGFYPPSCVYIDINFLQSLDVDAVKSGIGEILHFYLIDGNSSLAEELMSNYDELLSSPHGFKRYIFESLMIKKKVIEIDEFDRNKRNLFNYGHTFGHAIETVTHYSVSHGQAVTMGMDIANFISFSLGYMDKMTFKFMHQILKKNMPSFHLSSDTVGQYFNALSRDKKNVGKSLGCILSSGPGAMKKILLCLDDKLKSIILAYFDE